MRDCCNRRRAFTHLDVSPMKGIFRIQYLFVFSRNVFETSWSMVGSAEIIYLKFVGQVPLSVVFLTYRIELVLPHSLLESRKSTCDT